MKKTLLSVLIGLTISFCCCAQSTTFDKTKAVKDSKTKTFNSVSSATQMKNMGMGWNLGNTFDATYGVGLNTETGWGMPKTTKPMIDGLAKSGIKTIRIPVSWSHHILDKKSDLALGYHRFSSQINDKVKEVDVLTTVNEYNTVEYNSDEYLYDFGPSADINYNIFNDDIIDALSALGYVSNYILHHGSDENMDLLLYNDSFGIDINGKNKVL